jgi:hypothetical protein
MYLIDEIRATGQFWKTCPAWGSGGPRRRWRPEPRWSPSGVEYPGLDSGYRAGDDAGGLKFPVRSFPDEPRCRLADIIASPAGGKRVSGLGRMIKI